MPFLQTAGQLVEWMLQGDLMGHSFHDVPKTIGGFSIPDVFQELVQFQSRKL